MTVKALEVINYPHSEEVTNHLHSDIPNPGFEIYAMDEKGFAGQHNRYHVTYETPVAISHNGCVSQVQAIQFQNGPVPEVGTNGITVEALMGICAHRLEGFQNGTFPCEENAVALQHLYKGLEALHSRTLKRMTRGVEGKLEK